MAALTRRFDDAVAYAHDVHRSQRRKSTEIPYVAHLLAVASLTLEDGGSEDETIAALLHDAVEDGGAARLPEIRDRFGEEVAAIVFGCSDTHDNVGKPPWRKRKERYLAHLETAGPSVLRVSNADKLHNARSIVADHRRIGDDLWQRFNPEARSAEAHLWYLGALAEVFGWRRPGSFLADELRRTVEELAAAVGP